MKLRLLLVTLIFVAMLTFSLSMSACITRRAAVSLDRVMDNQAETSFDLFYRSLSPHGHWVTIGSYGPCWRPAGLRADWRPYFTNGYWTYTQYGWTWISQHAWGSIVFHYGGWHYDAVYGWVWVPGYVWGPAWVTWYYTQNYVGWAPLPPNYRFHSRTGYFRQPVIVSYDQYIFVPSESLNVTNLNTVQVPVERQVEIIRQAHPITTIEVINNHIVNHGPVLTSLENVKRLPVPIEKISQVSITPRPVRPPHEQVEIEVASPELNKQEVQRAKVYSTHQERAAKADRNKQLNQQHKQKNEPPGIPSLPRKTEKKIERTQPPTQLEPPQQPSQHRREQNKEELPRQDNKLRRGEKEKSRRNTPDQRNKP
ncbi:MAG: DUF6600 domain-containing protein [Acidobacteriota bacterium]